MIKAIPPAMMPVEEEMLAAMRAFCDEAKRYDAALDRYIAALREGQAEPLAAPASHADGAKTSGY